MQEYFGDKQAVLPKIFTRMEECKKVARFQIKSEARTYLQVVIYDIDFFFFVYLGKIVIANFLFSFYIYSVLTS